MIVFKSILRYSVLKILCACLIFTRISVIYSKNDPIIIGKELLDVSSLTDFDYRMNIIFRDIFHPSLTRTQEGLDQYDYRIDSGYESDLYPQLKDAHNSYNKKTRVVYECNENDFYQLASVRIIGNRLNRRFQSHRLFSLLRNKQVAFIGDSLARQYFLDLSAEVRPWQSYVQFGTIPEIRTILTDPTFTASNIIHNREKVVIEDKLKDEESVDIFVKDVFTRRYYAKFNTTLLWCQDAYLNHIPKQKSADWKNASTGTDLYPSHCDRAVLMDSDVIVVAVGAWFKPLYNVESPLEEEGYPDLGYYEDLVTKSRKLRSAAEQYRELVRQHGKSNAIVLWSLLPHTGLIDEIRFVHGALHSYYPGNGTTPTAKSQENNLWGPHDDGRHWSQLRLAALYPAVFNQLIRQIANQYRDDFLDIWRLSWLYLRHFSDGVPLPMELPHKTTTTLSDVIKEQTKHMRNESSIKAAAHVDSLHYCPGSLYRGGLSLLQMAVEHRLEIQRRHEVHRRRHQRKGNSTSLGEISGSAYHPSKKQIGRDGHVATPFSDLDIVLDDLDIKNPFRGHKSHQNGH